MSGAIAVFVKTPELSPIKTRLARKLGQKNAEAFHLASSRSVSSVVQNLSLYDDVQGYYAVAEESALSHHYWQNLPCLWQGEGGLGERMSFIYQTLLAQHDYVILVGADIPQMTTQELLVASAWLSYKKQARLAFGASVDGGFWLFGGNCDVPHFIWTDTTYSEADTGAQFFKKIQQVGDVKNLAILRDIDEEEDLIPLRQDLLNLTDILPAQQELIGFLGTLPNTKKYNYA